MAVVVAIMLRVCPKDLDTVVVAVVLFDSRGLAEEVLVVCIVAVGSDDFVTVADSVTFAVLEYTAVFRADSDADLVTDGFAVILDVDLAVAVLAGLLVTVVDEERLTTCDGLGRDETVTVRLTVGVRVARIVRVGEYEGGAVPVVVAVPRIVIELIDVGEDVLELVTVLVGNVLEDGDLVVDIVLVRVVEEDADLLAVVDLLRVDEEDADLLALADLLVVDDDDADLLALADLLVVVDDVADLLALAVLVRGAVADEDLLVVPVLVDVAVT